MANSILSKAEDLARSEIGYREGPKNNETMFGAWFGMNFVAWCAIFQSWVSFFSGTTYLGQPWRFASTIAARAHAKKNARWTTTPTVGTIAMMAHDATTGHVGFVIALLMQASQLNVVTIEGNTNDQGAREGNGVWLRARSASSWDGYIVLDQTYLNDSEDKPKEEDDMPRRFYRIRDEDHQDQPHPTKGNAIWVSDEITTNIMSEAQWVHGKNMKWYDESKVELIPETFHAALLETSRGGNLGGESLQSMVEAIKAELDNPSSDGGIGQISKVTIDAIAKAVLDEEHKRTAD